MLREYSSGMAVALRVTVGALGVCWTLAGTFLLLSIAASGIAIGALTLIPGGIGWVATSADAWVGPRQLAIAALVLAAGAGTFAMGTVDLAWAEAPALSRRAAFVLVAVNVCLAIALAGTAWLLRIGAGMVALALMEAA